MTHKDAILAILSDTGVSKRELAARCHYPSGTPAIDPRLRSDLKLSTLRLFVEALGYNVVLVPQVPGKPAFVLDENVPESERCGNNPGGRPGPRKRSATPDEKTGAKTKKTEWTRDALFRRFGMEEV